MNCDSPALHTDSVLSIAYLFNIRNIAMPTGGCARGKRLTLGSGARPNPSAAELGRAEPSPRVVGRTIARLPAGCLEIDRRGRGGTPAVARRLLEPLARLRSVGRGRERIIESGTCLKGWTSMDGQLCMTVYEIL